MSYRLSLLLVTCLTGLGVIPVLPLGLRVDAAVTLQEITNSTDAFAPGQRSGTNAFMMELAQSESSPSPSATPELPNLLPGSQGQAVTQLQTILQELGHYTAAVDGKYGDSTAEAVSKFQQAAGLTADGRVNTETWEKLIAAQATEAIEATNTSTDASGATESTAETESAEATNASSSGLTWWILSFLVVLGVAGGLFYFLRMEKLDAKRPSSSLKGGLADQSPTLETPTRPYFPNGSSKRDLVRSEVVSGHMEDASDMEGTSRLSKIDIVQELVRDLHSPDPSKRRKAIWELGQRGDSQSLQPLVDMMIDADSSQRNLILAAISEIGVRSLKPVNRALLISLQDNSPDVRKNAIRDLTRIYDQVAQVSHLLRHAAEDGDDEVRETARWALGQLNRIKTLTDSLPESGANSTALPNSVKQEQLPQDSSTSSDRHTEESEPPSSNYYSENSSGSNYYSEDAPVSGTSDSNSNSNSNSTNETFW
ncbi:peptidoglycan-binding protein [Leptolyngbya sp. FACHB-671]|uniref:peptidoglycan-binding protein n=1 Tax=Leptolyngbya sp. FACHB-671 TaxID=2692812 RepID=UPI0018EF464B|nr:peptidoglycan-binding protein [Leptolyngbya sp. FACHB-671]